MSISYSRDSACLRKNWKLMWKFRWYTSLIGKYSSLMGLVAKLRKLKVSLSMYDERSCELIP